MNNDLISRSALKDRAKTMLKIIGEDNLSDYEQGKKYAFETAIDFIDNAPTVETDIEEVGKDAYKQGYTDGWKERFGEPNERPQGEWFVNPHSMVMKCMNCGHEETATDVGVVNKDKHFCYWCGADMRKGGAE